MDEPVKGQGEPGGDEFPIIEGYDVIDLIGRGGMGAVYEALQQSTGRRVAVKLMLERAGATDAARRRFEREVELIARLQHPGIVSVLDSGLHRSRYYYVMEHVEGKPLDDALPPGKCPVREALRAIAKVARAVEYAHQRGVMHRDLKPTNILVDERGEPRLLDFGLAKAFDPNSLVNVRDSLSEPGQVIGTLGYMSPEQARGAVAEVSVRADVYALGAIAYELVTGSLPCAIDGPMAIVFHRIESRDPDRPSSLRKEVDADVDAMLLKALEKSPVKRYSTAAEFADDLERWLEGRPIRARRVSPAERATRWCRRNPALAGMVLAAVLLAVLLPTAFGIAAWQRAVKIQKIAFADSVDAEGIDNVKALDPDKSPGLADFAMKSLLKIENNLINTPRPPEREALWRVELGVLYKKWRNTDAALANLNKALELHRSLSDKPSETVASCLNHIGGVYWFMGQADQAERYCRESLEMRRVVHPEPNSPEVAESLNYLAQSLGLLRKFDEAERLQREAIEVSRARFGDESVPYIANLNNFATLRRWQGDFAGAERLHQEALDALLKSLKGKKHRNVATSLRNIAYCRMEQGRLDGVGALLVEARSIASDFVGDQSPDVALINDELARFDLESGRFAEAEAAATDALNVQRVWRSDDHPETAATRVLLGRIRTAAGRPEEGETEIRVALDHFLAAKPRREVDVASAKGALGESLLAQGRNTEALPLLREAWTVLERELGMGQRRTIACAQLLAKALDANGDPASAAALRDRAGKY